MKKRFKQAVSMILSFCLLFSLLPIDGWSLGTVMAAENGTLQNGALTSNADGWTIGGNYAYDFESGCLNLWNSEAGSFTMSQTVENVAAGIYYAKVAIVGSGSQGASESKDNLTLKVSSDSKEIASVKLTTDGWDNWNNVISTEAMDIAEGENITITISGELEAEEWYQIKNVVFETDMAVEAPITVQKVDGLSEDFIHGVDVSMYLSEVQSGVKYYNENGEEQNLFQILKDAGVNYVRLRLWNCPYAVDENGDYKYVDENGKEYSADKVHTVKPSDVSADDGTEVKEWEEYFLEDGTQVYREGYGAGNCGIDTVTAIGKVATQYGMKVLIDFHYSDFWADPKKQSVPKAWTGMTLEEKTTALSDFTTESLNTLKAAGVDVGMVQIGNEINNGMAGETDSSKVYSLLKAGSAAVRAVDSNILIAVHYTDPQSEGYQLNKAAELADAKVDYDVFATSYYPFWHGTPEQLTANLKEIADTYQKKVMVAEVSYAWTFEDGDGYGNVVNESATDQAFNYSIDIEGQATAIRDTIAAVAAVGEKGIGTFYWEPAWVPVNVYDADADNAAEILEANKKAWRLYGSGWGSIYGAEVDPEIKDDLNGGTWDNQAYFDFNGKALPSLNVYKWVYTGAEGPTKVSTVSSASYEMNYKAAPVLPETVEVNLNDGTVINVPVTWNEAQVEALRTADFGDYTVDGTVGAFSYTTRGEVVQVAAGTWTTTCAVKVTGTNLVKNGSFEENDGDGSGWTLINYLNDNAGSPGIGKSSSNAKSGLYYYTAWDQSQLDFAIEQNIADKVSSGVYTLFAYYQGTGVEELKDTSSLYAVVTYQDGTAKEYKAEVQINNVWKDFYQAKVKDIPINSKVKSIKVGTRLSCTGTAIGAWIVVDDISLMKQEELTSYTVTFKDGAKVISTQSVNQGEDAAAPNVTKNGYSLTWDKTFTNVTGDLTVNAVWTANKYKVTYNVNGGKKIKTTSKTVTYGTKYGTLPTVKRKGYTFAGWYTAKTKGTKITANSVVKITKNTTLYARWKKVTKPAKVSAPTLKNSSKKTMKVSFKKVKGAAGYRITYSTTKKFTKKTTKSVTLTKLSKSIGKLKKGKTYYVKVQAYKKDSTGAKVYGAYSKVKSIKIKK